VNDLRPHCSGVSFHRREARADIFGLVLAICHRGPGVVRLKAPSRTGSASRAATSLIVCAHRQFLFGSSLITSCVRFIISRDLSRPRSDMRNGAIGIGRGSSALALARTARSWARPLDGEGQLELICTSSDNSRRWCSRACAARLFIDETKAPSKDRDVTYTGLITSGGVLSHSRYGGCSENERSAWTSTRVSTLLVRFAVVSADRVRLLDGRAASRPSPT